MSLGKQIARLRREQDWTQEELAKKLEVHVVDISRWERDKNRPQPRHLEKLAQVLEVPLEELKEANGRATAAARVRDPELLRQFELAQELDEEDRILLTRFLQALVTKKRMEKVLQGQA
jgi:transcriptional regulator with XRE-family HTH domain